jgi:thiol-disulfide isomerase/thioredoxin
MPKYYLEDPIYSLEDQDFDSNGNLINSKIPKNIPVLIMIQADFCGYCTKAKPEFEKFAKKNEGKIFTATIIGDGDRPGEQALSKRLKIVDPTFRGFPSYVAYKNGKRVGVHEGGRSATDLENFIKQF